MSINDYIYNYIIIIKYIAPTAPIGYSHLEPPIARDVRDEPREQYPRVRFSNLVEGLPYFSPLVLRHEFVRLREPVESGPAVGRVYVDDVDDGRWVYLFYGSKEGEGRGPVASPRVAH